MTTLTVNIKDISQTTIIKKILKAFDVEVIEQNNEITNPENIERLEKHHKNFQDPCLQRGKLHQSRYQKKYRIFKFDFRLAQIFQQIQNFNF